ncbi:hypothetical protein PoB_001944800 [Plakobranchus ocellatus]|uniref:Uncharacterized protein n=1 Tax=Plakobranchus ocellatus TaxID=259542 RepID=A0AAV3ZDX2_9GAST|nr:hypothetical protein PoB_001944800 [Plakobranchus ocellatus]
MAATEPVPVVPNFEAPAGNWIARNLRLANEDSKELFPQSRRGISRDKYHSLYKVDFHDYPTDCFIEGLKEKAVKQEKKLFYNCLTLAGKLEQSPNFGENQSSYPSFNLANRELLLKVTIVPSYYLANGELNLKATIVPSYNLANGELNLKATIVPSYNLANGELHLKAIIIPSIRQAASVKQWK